MKELFQTCTILFVCKGNRFRSLSAQAALQLLAKEENWDISSAGLGPLGPVDPIIIEDLKQRGIDVTKHEPRLVTQKMLSPSTQVIAMDSDIQSSLMRLYDVEVPTFIEFSTGAPGDILDTPEAFPDGHPTPEERERYLKDVIEKIFLTTPLLYKKIKDSS